MSALWLGRSRLTREVPMRQYRLAGVDFHCPRPLAALDAFSVVGDGPDSGDLPPIGHLDGGTIAMSGPIGGTLRSVEALYRAGACTLSVEGVGRFRIDSRRVTFPHSRKAPLSSALVETLTGPALLLTLAARGRYALHAGATLIAGAGLWVLLGDSGVGKSTLAGYARSVAGCQPVADDLLPVCWQAGRLWALPWYPQLKLGPQGQYAGGATAERLTVAGIAVLEPAAPSADVTVVPLSGREAISALTRQTVSARLFSPRMLAQHFQFFAQAAGAIPMYRLGVPRDTGRLVDVYQTLARFRPIPPLPRVS